MLILVNHFLWISLKEALVGFKGPNSGPTTSVEVSVLSSYVFEHLTVAFYSLDAALTHARATSRWAVPGSE